MHLMRCAACQAQAGSYNPGGMPIDLLGQRLARAGAWLLTVGMATGVWAGLVLTETIKVPIPRLALAAHLNAILGAFWLIAVASTLDRDQPEGAQDRIQMR